MRRRDIRRLELAFVVFSFGEHATWLAVLVFALERGAPARSASVAVVQLLPGVFLAPLAAYAGDRFAPQRALAAGYGLQCVSMASRRGHVGGGAAGRLRGGDGGGDVRHLHPSGDGLDPADGHPLPAELIAANTVTGVVGAVRAARRPLVAGADGRVVAGDGVRRGRCRGRHQCAARAGGRPDRAARAGRTVGAADVLSQAFGGFAALGETACCAP